MMTMLTYFLCYVFFFGGFVFLGFSRLDAKRRNKNPKSPRISLDEITVIVPFRDETSSIGTLIQSINQSHSLPARFIFVDDHSNDDTADVIYRFIEKARYDIITNKGIGKKAAIRSAISLVETKYVLTMDADVWFETSYFTSLTELEAKDLLVLPVVMHGKGAKSFFELDVLLANALNAGISGVARPFMASGANLLFQKDVFQQIDSYENHKHIPSGDDAFLLSDFVLHKKFIELSNDPRHQVNTAVPDTWKALLSQRIRWVGKTTKVKDQLATVVGLIQFIFSMLFYIILISLIFYWQVYQLAIFFFAIKTLLDLVFFSPYFSRFNKANRLLLFPIYELLFPIYSLVILGGMIFGKWSWKGRRI